MKSYIFVSIFASLLTKKAANRSHADWHLLESRAAGYSWECSNSLITLQQPRTSSSVSSSFWAYWARRNSLIRRFVFRQADLYIWRFASVRLWRYRCSRARRDRRAMMAFELSHWFDGLPHRFVTYLTGASWLKILVSELCGVSVGVGLLCSADLRCDEQRPQLVKLIDLMFCISKVSHLGCGLTVPRVATTTERSDMPASSTCILVISGFSGDVIMRSSSSSQLCVDPRMRWTRL